MSHRLQSWVLIGIATACALMILLSVAFVHTNNRLNQNILLSQSEVNQTQMLQSTWQYLIRRLARESRNEPALKALLLRHGFRFRADAENAPADQSQESTQP